LDAFEAMISEGWSYCGPERTSKAQTASYEATLALRDRLAQPEAKPIKRSFSDDVGRLLKAGKGFYDDGTPIDYKDIQLKIEGAGEDTFECVEVRIPRPPQREWVGLESDEQILEISKDVWGKDKLNRGRDDHRPFYIDFARAVEAKLKEKNA
jgi:hypothetical protein